MLRKFWTEWTIALHFLKDGRAQTLMIITGVAVGVSVVVFITALIQGLQSNIIDRTLGTQAHIRLLPPEEINLRAPIDPDAVLLVQEIPRAQRLRSIDNWQALEDLLDGLPDLSAVSPVVSGPAFARRGEALESVALVGIDLPRYRRIIPIEDSLSSGALRVGAGDAMIGQELADKLGLSVGDKLRIDTGQQNTTVVNVAGIFEFGVRDLDERFVYLDLRQAQSLLDLPGGVTVIDLTVEDIFDAEAIGRQLEALIGLDAESWMETNAQLMNALSAQSLSTNLIKIFVGLSVAFGIASVLSISVVQRTREIGILRATGASRQQILRVFLIEGAIFGLLGSLPGTLVAYGLVWVFNRFGPGLFYIPVPGSLVLTSVALATLTGLLAAALPSRRAARLDPVEAIRDV